MKETFTYKDATITVNAGVFSVATIDVTCGAYSAKGLSVEQFAALVYPALEAQAKTAGAPVIADSGEGNADASETTSES